MQADNNKMTFTFYLTLDSQLPIPSNGNMPYVSKLFVNCLLDYMNKLSHVHSVATENIENWPSRYPYLA